MMHFKTRRWFFSITFKTKRCENISKLDFFSNAQAWLDSYNLCVSLLNGLCVVHSVAKESWHFVLSILGVFSTLKKALSMFLLILKDFSKFWYQTLCLYNRKTLNKIGIEYCYVAWHYIDINHYNVFVF